MKLTASDSEIGDALDCAACGGPATQQLETQLFRHGDALVALSKMSSNGKTPNLIELTVDGAVTPLPQLEGARWYNFGEKYGSDPVTPSVMQLRTGDDTPDTYWHWDGSWKQIATFPAPGVLTAEPKLDAAGAWMWRQNQRSAARQLLVELDADEWALKPRYREEVSRALALVNAPAELAARVQTLARGQ